MSPMPASRPCRAFLDDFSAFVDGHLSAGRIAEIQAHVDCCQGCLDHLTAYRRGITVLRSADAVAPVDFWERLERRLRAGHELTLIEGGLGKRGTVAAGSGRWPGSAVSVAAAAVLALLVILRGVGTDSPPAAVGPRSVRASVAMTVPEVPQLPARVALGVAPEARNAPAGSPSASPVRVGRPRRDPPALARADFRSSVSLIRVSAAVTPAPWTIDRALSLP